MSQNDWVILLTIRVLYCRLDEVLCGNLYCYCQCNQLLWIKIYAVFKVTNLAAFNTLHFKPQKCKQATSSLTSIGFRGSHSPVSWAEPENSSGFVPWRDLQATNLMQNSLLKNFAKMKGLRCSHCRPSKRKSMFI